MQQLNALAAKLQWTVEQVRTQLDAHYGRVEGGKCGAALSIYPPRLLVAFRTLTAQLVRLVLDLKR